jgi:hypothetical protein
MNRWQYSLWQDIHDGPAEAAIAEIMNPLCLKIDTLSRRHEDWRHPKPRIDLHVNITSKQNLAVLWEPTGWGSGESDWHRWWQFGQSFGERPSNELMFLRGVRNLSLYYVPPGPPDPAMDRLLLKLGVDRSRPRVIPPELLAIDRVILQAVLALLSELKARLSHCFVVSVMSDIWPTWTDDDGSGDGSGRELVKWELLDRQEMDKRQAQADLERTERSERAELARFSSERGITIEAVLGALGATDNIGAAGKLLRSQGHNIHAGHIKRLLELLRRHDPGALPEKLRDAE